MRLRLFTDIEARLSRVRLVDGKFICHRPKCGSDAPVPGSPAINLVGLWNENVTRLTQMRPFTPPAVFVEFFPVNWSPMSRNVVHGDMTVRLHIVTATLATTDTPYRDEALARFRLIRVIKKAFAGFAGSADAEGRSFSTFQYLESLTDHNHEQITEDLEAWRTHCIDAADYVDNGYDLSSHNITLDTGDVFADQFGEEMV